MLESTDNDTNVTYKEKGNVSEYLGNTAKEKVSSMTVDAPVADDAVADDADDTSVAKPLTSSVQAAWSPGMTEIFDEDTGDEGVEVPVVDDAPVVDDIPSDTAILVNDAASIVDYTTSDEVKEDVGSEYDSSDEENYKKLETDINSQDLLQKHPCSIEHSYAEIQAFTKIIRNEKGEIVDELHKTLPFVTKYEYARIIGVRTKELNEGADPFVEFDHNIIDGYNIAIKELEEKKLPFIVKRPLPNGSCEYWKLSDLELIHF